MSRAPANLADGLLAAGPRMTQAERVAALVAQLGGPTRAAEVAHVSRQTVSNWTTGRTLISMPEALELARACGVTLDWIATGHDRRPDLAVPAPARGGFCLVYRYEAAADGRLVEIEDASEAAVAFREGWLADLGIAPVRAALLTARGDAMAPTVREGDLLLVDRGVTRIAGDGIYVISRTGALAIRRAQVLVDGAVMLIADNPRYHPERIEAGQVASIAVAGRVRLGLEFL